MKPTIDKIDAKIIDYLQQDGRTPYNTIAKRLSISDVTVRSRVKRLMDEGVIQVVAVCDPQKIGFPLSGNIWLQVDPKKLNHVIDELNKIQEIWYVSLNTGQVDMNLVFNSHSLEHLERLLYEKINPIDGVTRSETSIIVSYKKRNYHWGIGFKTEQRLLGQSKAQEDRPQPLADCDSTEP